MKKLLKKTLLLIPGILLVSLSHATTHLVTVQNFSFSPSNFSAAVGDTVEWEWVGGTHTTTSLTIPAAAAAWNNNINSTTTVFKYVITATGTYNYWCAIHTTMMEASFTVAVTGIQNIANSSKEIAQIFPNPATNMVNIQFNNLTSKDNAVLIVLDITGKQMVSQMVTNVDNTIDVTSWKKGIYLYRIQKNGETMMGKLEVK